MLVSPSAKFTHDDIHDDPLFTVVHSSLPLPLPRLASLSLPLSPPPALLGRHFVPVCVFGSALGFEVW